MISTEFLARIQKGFAVFFASLGGKLMIIEG